MANAKHYLTPVWDAPANVHVAMTLRTGGVSAGQFASLNPATHVNDDLAAVTENRALIKQILNLPSEPVWLNQVHSDVVINLDLPGFKNLKGLENADASFTSQSGVVCAVMTADCLPLAFCSKDGEKIAAVHAGWKGLLAGVITNTVAALLDTTPDLSGFKNLKGLKPSDLLVWLAPAIGAEKFEVGSEVRELFIQKNPAFAAAFRPAAPEKYLADIYQLAKIELAGLGVTQIVGGEFCTVSDPERFYSYRRDNSTGRMATLIWKD
jgi:YfiH family protein